MRVPSVGRRLAGADRMIDVDRTYVRHAAVRVATSEPSLRQVAMAENTAVAARGRVVDQAVRLRGAEVERHYRDAGIPGIGGGTTEIMNEIIAQQLGV